MTRAEAKTLGLTRYTTGLACLYGHIAERLTCNATCIVCLLAKQKQWRVDNPEENLKRSRVAATKHKAKDPVRAREVNRQACIKGGKARVDRITAWQQANPEKTKVIRKAYRARNPHIIRANTVLRVVRERQQCPPWADLRAIQAVYWLCAKTTRETGIPHHVDHIVPLRGKTVSGLHVHWNLQVIPAVENLRKGAKHS